MSRTWKDTPGRIQLNRARGSGAIRHRCGHRFDGTYRECDARAVREHGMHGCRPWWARGGHFSWYAYERDARECGMRYWAPERAAVRAELGRMTREARAADAVTDIDDSFAPLDQHRHATFGGGWWD